MKKIKRIITLTTLVIASFWYFPLQAAAELIPGQDVMILLDTSFTMTVHDPNREIYEAINYLALLSEDTQNRLGYLVYSDTIVTQRPLQRVHDPVELYEEVEDLKALQPIRATDVGLALQVAHTHLLAENYREGNTALILISDGQTDLITAIPNRTQEEVDQDIEAVLSEVNYPIFTIQYSEVEVRNESPMNQWDKETGGANFSAGSREELIAILHDLYQDLTGLSSGEEVQTQSLDGEAFNLIVPIPETETQRAEEVQVTLMGSDVIQDIILPQTDTQIEVTTIGRQSIITITDPTADQYEISYLTTTGQPLQSTTLTRMVDKEASAISWLFIGQVIFGLVGVTGLALGLYVFIKRRNKQVFVGRLECYFMETPRQTVEIPIQSWTASVLQKEQKISLYDLLKNVPLREMMPEARRLWIEVRDSNTLIIRNQEGVECFKNGQDITHEKTIVLPIGSGTYLIFRKGTIELELRVRKGSLTKGSTKIK